MRKLLLLIMLFSFVQGNAQICPGCKIQSKKPIGMCAMGLFISDQETDYGRVERHAFNFVQATILGGEGEYTSLAFSVYSKNIDKIKVKIGEEIFQLIEDEHFFNDSFQRSQLIIPVAKAKVEVLIENGESVDFEIHFINVPKLGADITQPQPTKLKRANCEEPATVSYTVWRDGLDPPVPGRQATQVEHCIVHHSATSNAQTNYVEVMRNIYVYHTEVNGWDDIGYNYVVAPDGTIFLGRDPQGVADQDNILGAHFCSKNSNTMGICMMGTYTDVSPSISALTALEDLLTWKMNKERLYPLGESTHPHGVGSMLGNLAGHRDGCPTECPGTQTYNLLGNIKQNVLNNLYDCGTFVSIDDIEAENKIAIYPNPSSGVFTIKGLAVGTSYDVLNTMGQTVLTGSITQAEAQLTLPTGLYFFTTADGYTKKLVVQ